MDVKASGASTVDVRVTERLSVELSGASKCRYSGDSDYVKIKADQIAATGADVVITPCHNCVDQLMQIDHHYKLGVEIKSVAEVVADALVMDSEK